MSESSSTPNGSRLQIEAVAWIDEVLPELAKSAWGPALRSGPVDVLDAIRTPLLFTALRLARDGAVATNQAVPSRWLWSALARTAYRAKQSLTDARARHLSRSSLPADVLFWPQLLTHVKQHLPTASCLRELGQSTGFLLTRPREFEMLSQREQNVSYVGQAFPRATIEARRETAQAAKVLASDPGSKLPVFPFRNLPSQSIVQELRLVIEASLGLVSLNRLATEAAIKKLAPKAIVVGNDITPEGRTQCLVARTYNVLTVSPMHGIVSGEPLQGKHVADAVFTYGEHSKNDMIALGESPSRIHVCGAAHLMNRRRQSGTTDPRVASAAGLSVDRPWVLVATSGPGHSVSVEHHRRVIEAVMRLSQSMPQIKFVAKLHPKDRLEYYHDARRAVGNSPLVIIPAKSLSLDFNVWLQGCSAVITGGSAAGLDALLMDVPVISVDLAGELDAIDFIEEGASLHVCEEARLQPALESILRKSPEFTAMRDRVHRFLSQAFHLLEGNPADCAARKIIELINQPR